jgi:hypothetical protein
VHAKVPRWTPSASISLSPGDYDIRIEGGTGRYILLPDGAPLPTDP